MVTRVARTPSPAAVDFGVAGWPILARFLRKSGIPPSWAAPVDGHTSTLALQVDPIVAGGRFCVCDDRHSSL